MVCSQTIHSYTAIGVIKTHKGTRLKGLWIKCTTEELCKPKSYHSLPIVKR